MKVLHDFANFCFGLILFWFNFVFVVWFGLDLVRIGLVWFGLWFGLVKNEDYQWRRRGEEREDKVGREG